MTTLTGRCLCGATRITVTATPRFGIRCYCRDCQRVTGGASAPQVAFARDSVEISGAAKTHAGRADSGSDLGFTYCADCGSPVAKTTSRAADLVFLYAGLLDDPSAVPHLRPVFEDSRPAWDIR